MQDDDPTEWIDPVDSIVRDIVEMDQKRKHARIHCHEKKEEVKTGSCARVPSYLAQVQDVSLRYDSLFYESFIFIHNMMICAGVTHRSR